MTTFLQETIFKRNLRISFLLVLSILLLPGTHAVNPTSKGGVFKGISLKKTIDPLDSLLFSFLNKKKVNETEYIFQEKDYHLIIENLKSISGNDADITDLRKLIAITLVDHKIKQLQYIINSLPAKKDEILESVFYNLVPEQKNFFEYLFLFYYRKKRYIYGRKGKLNSGRPEWEQEHDDLFNKTWTVLLKLSQDQNFTIHIDAKDFLACCAIGNQHLFDQFLKFGDEQHKNDHKQKSSQYWLNRYIQWEDMNDLFFTTILYSYIDFHFHKRDNLTKIHEGGIYTEYIYNSLIKKTKTENDRPPQIDILKKNYFSDSLIEEAPTLFVPIAIYDKEYATRFLEHNIMIYYKRDCQKVFNELKNKAILSNIKTLEALQSIDLLTEKDNTKKKVKVTYINALRKEPTLDFLNFCADRKGGKDSMSATFFFGKVRKKGEKVDMLAVLQLLKTLIKFDGIVINKRHYDMLNKYYDPQNPFYKDKNNSFSEKRKSILELMNQVKNKELIISSINQENNMRVVQKTQTEEEKYMENIINMKKIDNQQIFKVQNSIDNTKQQITTDFKSSNTQLDQKIVNSENENQVLQENDYAFENENNTQNLLGSLGNYFGNIYVWIISIFIIGTVTAATFIFYRRKKASKGNQNHD